MIISQIEIKLPLLYFNEEDENREKREENKKLSVFAKQNSMGHLKLDCSGLPNV
jgi:hypothetical protein